MAELARMRTLNGLYDEIHRADPGSGISKYFLRQLLIQNKVNVVYSGKKRLASLDEVMDYLSNPQPDSESGKESSYGKLRQAK
jgi:predicted aldo/keto reductase-like oxidoreductase